MTRKYAEKRRRGKHNFSITIPSSVSLRVIRGQIPPSFHLHEKIGSCRLPSCVRQVKGRLVAVSVGLRWKQPGERVVQERRPFHDFQADPKRAQGNGPEALDPQLHRILLCGQDQISPGVASPARQVGDIGRRVPVVVGERPEVHELPDKRFDRAAKPFGISDPAKRRHGQPVQHPADRAHEHDDDDGRRINAARRFSGSSW